MNIQDWSGFIGQWDTRLWKNQSERDWAISANHAAWPPADEQEREQRPVPPRYPDDYIGLQPAIMKPAEIAWFASHHHTADGLNQPYEYSYLFAYPIVRSAGEESLTFPNNEKIRILAISTAEETPRLFPVQHLFDTFNEIEPTGISARTAR